MYKIIILSLIASGTAIGFGTKLTTSNDWRDDLSVYQAGQPNSDGQSVATANSTKNAAKNAKPAILVLRVDKKPKASQKAAQKTAKAKQLSVPSAVKLASVDPDRAKSGAAKPKKSNTQTNAVLDIAKIINQPQLPAKKKLVSVIVKSDRAAPVNTAAADPVIAPVIANVPLPVQGQALRRKQRDIALQRAARQKQKQQAALAINKPVPDEAAKPTSTANSANYSNAVEIPTRRVIETAAVAHPPQPASQTEADASDQYDSGDRYGSEDQYGSDDRYSSNSQYDSDDDNEEFAQPSASKAKKRKAKKHVRTAPKRSKRRAASKRRNRNAKPLIRRKVHCKNGGNCVVRYYARKPRNRKEMKRLINLRRKLIAQARRGRRLRSVY